MKRWRLWTLLAVMLVVAAAAVPLLRADRFREPLRQALERATGRQVTLGEVRFQLLRGPGLSATDVVVSDDAAFGVEALTTIPRMEVTFAPLSLLQGRLECSAVRLLDPSINLVRNSEGRWNMQAMVEKRGSGAGTANPGSSVIPLIEIEDGRLNVKIGDEKSPLFLANTDASLRMERMQGRPRVAFRLYGQPARTDRHESGFGAVSTEGAWQRDAKGVSRLDASVRLERTAIAELLTLLQGETKELRGYLVSRATVNGPVGDLRIRGTVQSDELKRWEVTTPWSSASGLRYEGSLRLHEGTLQIASVDDAGTADEARIRVEGRDLLSAPAWQAEARLSEAPISELIPLVRQLGLALPDPQPSQGRASGAVSYSSATGLEGSVELKDVEWKLDALGTVRATTVPVVFRNQDVAIQNAAVVDAEGREAMVSASYAWSDARFSLTIAGQTLPVAALQGVAGKLPMGEGRLGLDRLRGGVFNGQIQLAAGPEGQPVWSAVGMVSQAMLSTPDLAKPLLITGRVKSAGDNLELERCEFRAGDVAGNFDFANEPGMPAKLRLRIKNVDASALEALLAPVLQSNTSWLDRATGGRGDLWLRSRNVSISAEIAQFSMGDTAANALKLEGLWKGAEADWRIVAGKVGGGRVSGTVRVQLKGGRPAYSFDGRLDQMLISGGEASTQFKGASEGTGVGLLTSLRASGTFAGMGIPIATEGSMRQVQGAFELTGGLPTPRLKVEVQQMMLGSESFRGVGTLEQSNRILFELSSASRQMRVTGSLVPFQLAAGG